MKSFLIKNNSKIIQKSCKIFKLIVLRISLAFGSISYNRKKLNIKQKSE